VRKYSAAHYVFPAVTPEKYATSECTRLLDKVYERRNLNRLVIDEVTSFHLVGELSSSIHRHTASQSGVIAFVTIIAASESSEIATPTFR